MGKTSTAAKQRWLNKNRRRFAAWLTFKEYDQLTEITERLKISKAEFLRRAIKKALD